MKQLLLALLGAAILVPTAVLPVGLLSEDEDPFDQRMREEDEIVAKHARALTEALAHARETGDYSGVPKVSGELVKAYERYAPSQMDMWEARQRLIEYIYDSDDETVFHWYGLIKESMRRDEEIARGIAEVMDEVDRMEQNLATQGVSLTPESLPPED